MNNNVSTRDDSNNGDDGSNGDYEELSANIENLVLREYVGETISVDTFVQLSKCLNIPNESVRKNFSNFIKNALNEGKIREIPTVMDCPHYVVVG